MLCGEMTLADIEINICIFGFIRDPLFEKNCSEKLDGFVKTS